VGYIECAEIGPCVALRLPLSQIVAAQQAFLAKSHVGKIVLEL
jgi:NADPH:quinone reductase-like Zn-dependent oxidoreductase